MLFLCKTSQVAYFWPYQAMSFLNMILNKLKDFHALSSPLNIKQEKVKFLWLYDSFGIVNTFANKVNSVFEIESVNYIENKFYKYLKQLEWH